MTRKLVTFHFDQLGEPRESRPPADRVIEGDIVCRNWDIDSAKDDGRLRSALKAWWRGLKLLCRRPIAVLAVYLGTTVAGLLLAVLLLLLRPYLGHGSVIALLLGLLLSSAVAAALAWSRIARLFGMQVLAEGMHARR